MPDMDWRPTLYSFRDIKNLGIMVFHDSGLKQYPANPKSKASNIIQAVKWFDMPQR